MWMCVSMMGNAGFSACACAPSAASTTNGISGNEPTNALRSTCVHASSNQMNARWTRTHAGITARESQRVGGTRPVVGFVGAKIRSRRPAGLAGVGGLSQRMVDQLHRAVRPSTTHNQAVADVRGVSVGDAVDTNPIENGKVVGVGAKDVDPHIVVVVGKIIVMPE